MKGILRWGRGVLLAGLVARGAETSTIDLATALRLAGARNLALEVARERVRESRGQLDQERARLFPWIAPGVGYRRHDGNLQDIVGDVFDASKQAGTAALTLQAQLDLGDATYRVLAARQAVAASEAGSEAGRRETVLSVAVAYTELGRASASVATADEARRITRGTLEQVRAAVAAGLASAGDIRRVEVQSGRNESAWLEARQAERVASARLAQLLRLPPAEPLTPDPREFVPMVLVPTNRALDSLVVSALRLRPELRRSEAVVGIAEARRKGATRGVWFPTVGAQASFGGLAGGRNGDWARGDDFQDYGLGLSWRIGPGGIGDGSRIRSEEARLRIARLERDQLQDEVVRGLVELRSRTETATRLVEVSGQTVEAARSLVETTRDRREFGVGVVLEAIEAERELARAQADQIQAVAGHNRAQWELWHASGQDQPPLEGTRP
jgi:outer membrane protein TolC